MRILFSTCAPASGVTSSTGSLSLDRIHQQTRTYFIHPALGFFFSPKQVNYHLEHPLYPAVPFYHLPRLHTLLRRVVYPQAHAYCEAFAASLRQLAQ